VTATAGAVFSGAVGSFTSSDRVAALSAGEARANVALGFAAGPEREGIIVRNDYETFLHRNPAQSEIESWVAAFEQGVSNENIVAGLARSDEFFRLVGQSRRLFCPALKPPHRCDKRTCPDYSPALVGTRRRHR
jgi:hypothetical protein